MIFYLSGSCCFVFVCCWACVERIDCVSYCLGVCVGVIPLALICGPIRGIPFFRQLIDCSFGVFGIIPLLICRGYVKRIERM